MASALQAGPGLQAMAAVTTDLLLPCFAGALKRPASSAVSRNGLTTPSNRRLLSSHAASSGQQLRSNIILPVMLRHASTDGIRASSATSVSSTSPILNASVSRPFATAGRVGLGLNASRISSLPSTSRSISTHSSSQSSPRGARSPFYVPTPIATPLASRFDLLRSLPASTTQTRGLWNGLRQNYLARLEQTANNNPASASSQNGFYTALLRANMPQIVIERYRSGRFAANNSTDALYINALKATGEFSPAALQGEGMVGGQAANNSGLTAEQLQSVGQAVAARQVGAQVAMSGRNPNGTGAKQAPLYVVVEESIGSTVFKWTKFFVIFAFIAYFLLIVLNVLMDTTGILKTARGNQANEAQPQQQKVRFSDVHGCDEAKDELQEVVEFLTNPDRFSSLGGKLPKGVLLVGPPGTGKTLLARAVAGEAGVPFFYMSGSEFDEVYVGVGAKRVRDLFSQARHKAPAIIFIDELDAIGAKRNERDAAYVKQTLNQLLTELDGFSQTEGVIILAATNYPQLLDKALTRPGRFDRKVEVGLPDVRGRLEILNHHMKDVAVGTDVDSAIIARGTPGFSGADLENLVNQAAIHASRNKKTRVGPKDFDWAKDKILMGAEARSRVMREKDKLATAYHEAGHALVAYYSRSATPLYKITIVPRGMSLGATHFLPEMDVVSKNYTEYLADIDVSMGGRAAEELIYGEEKVSSGISADLRMATNTAFNLVTQLGYSKKLGSMDFMSNYDNLSSETKQEIENECRRLLEEGRERAKSILTSRKKELELLTKALVEYETLTKEEMEAVLRGEKLKKLEDDLSEGPPPPSEIVLPEALTAAADKMRPNGLPTSRNGKHA